ncbi:MAG: hypothetical protein J0H64_09655 [Actinobacteria bacterium]|nr:hypothetical protein [Actinomycetota bacterium]
MIGTLFAQELRTIWKRLAVTIGIVLLVAAVSLVMLALRMPFFGALGLGVAILSAVILAPVTLCLLAENYWRTMYGREGYFTMSIPAHGRSVFAAKVLYGLLVCYVALGITALLLLATVTAYAMSVGQQPTDVLHDFLTGLGPAVAWFLVVSIALQSTYTVIVGAGLMSLGAEARFNHLGFGAPVIGAVILYFATQLLGLAAMVLMPLGFTITGPDAGHFVGQGMLPDLIRALEHPEAGNQPTVIGLGVFLVSIALSILFAWWGACSVERRTSLR